MNEGYGEPAADLDSLRLGELLETLLRSKLWVLTVAGLVTVGSVLWVATRQPRYRARATLLLEKAPGGALSELASLTSEPAAEAEIALIKSRSLAAVTVDPPEHLGHERGLFDRTEPDFDPFAVAASDDPAAAQGTDPSAMENLGLQWVVDRHDLRPARTMWATLTGASPTEHRLRASIEAETTENEEPPIALDVAFVEPNVVLVSEHSGFLLPGSDGERHEFHAGAPLSALGYRLTLFPSGDYVGQRYRLRTRTREEAITALMENTTAEESGRKSNVVYVTVEDSDPYRAAETANALCKNYIRRSVRIGQQKASQTVRFVQAQLETQSRALEVAEKAVVAVQEEHPETIALTESAGALVEQLSQLELDETRLRLARTAVDEALGYVEKGDAQAIARLGQELPNLLALAYIHELGQLEVESLRLDRTDVAGYKALLIAERQRVEGLLATNAVYVDVLESGRAALAAGDAAGSARLGALGREADFTPYVAEIADLEGEISRLGGTMTDDNPSLLALRDARARLVERLGQQLAGALEGAREAERGYRNLVADYERSIAEWPAEERGTIDTAVEGLRKRLGESLAAQAASVDEQLAARANEHEEVERRLAQLPAKELAVAEPLRERETRSRIVAFLMESLQEAQITAASTSAGAVLIDPAVPPLARSFPKATLFVLAGAFLGILLGGVLALVRESLRGALHSEAEVERVTGLPVLGVVPDYLHGRTRVKGARRGQRFLPMRDDPDGPQAEAYRSVRAALRLALDGEERLRTLAVTSCVPGEGKTVTNADLALVFASAGRRVLFVDSDLREPQVHALFGLPREPGFGDVLEGRANWRACVHTVATHGLSVLPAGKCTRPPGELLAAREVLGILDEMTADHDLVVFDLPPAIVVADVASFAHKLDALLLVYRAGGVPARLLSGAVARLRQSDVNLMGVLLNAVYVGRGPVGYGYGYGQGYGRSGRGKSSPS